MLPSFRRTAEFYLMTVLVVLIAYLGLTTEDFFSAGNLFELLVNYSFMGIMAAGLLVVLISGGIDISFTAVATVAQYLMASYLIRYGGNWWIAFFIAASVGLVLGAVNGLLVHYTKAPAIIITIATLNVFQGVLVFLTRGKWLYGFPEWFRQGLTLHEFNGSNGNVYEVNLPIVALAVVLAVTGFMLSRTVLGRQIYALGGNREAAERLGFSALRLHLFVYSYMGLLAGIASVVQAQIVQTVAPNAIVGRELEVLAAVVLGGATLTGGQGTVLGTVLGVALVAIMWNGLTLIGASSYWHQVLIGIVILVSVAITAYSLRGEERREVEGRIDTESA